MKVFIFVSALICTAMAAPAKLDISHHQRSAGYNYEPPAVPVNLYELPSPSEPSGLYELPTPPAPPPPPPPPQRDYIPPPPPPPPQRDYIPPYETAETQTRQPPPMGKMLMPYEFNYGVRDEESGNDFSHQTKSDGEFVTGQYSVLLPDGRMQVVKFTSNPIDGYRAEVSYF